MTGLRGKCLVEELLARIGAGGIVPIEGPDYLAAAGRWEALAEQGDDLLLVEAPEVDGQGVVAHVHRVHVVVVEARDYGQAPASRMLGLAARQPARARAPVPRPDVLHDAVADQEGASAPASRDPW